ncbi:MAG: CcmD family protein [Polyangia bacterium]
MKRFSQSALSFTLLATLTLGLAGAARADEVPGPATRPAASAPAVAPAVAPVAPVAPQPDKDGFVPESRPAEMTGSVEAGLPAVPLVAAAYGFIWLMVFGFVLSTLSRTSRLQREIRELAGKLDAIEKGGASGGRAASARGGQ